MNHPSSPPRICRDGYAVTGEKHERKNGNLSRVLNNFSYLIRVILLAAA